MRCPEAMTTERVKKQKRRTARERVHPLNGAGTPTSSGSRTPPLLQKRLKNGKSRTRRNDRNKHDLDSADELGTGDGSEDPVTGPLA